MAKPFFNIFKISTRITIISAMLSAPTFAETFSEAFSKARSAGLSEFTYNGNLYSTQTATEQSMTTYGPFPITLNSYSGTKTNTVSYTGQIARHVLHDSLKKLSSQGNGGENAAKILSEMIKYFGGSDQNLQIIAPKTKDGFPVKQGMVNDISKGKKPFRKKL